MHRSSKSDWLGFSSHSGLNPGTYKLQVQNEDWCFGALESEVEKKMSSASSTVSVGIVIAAENEEQEGDVVLHQTGYQMIILTTNEVNIDIVQSEERKLNADLVRDIPNHFCVGKKKDYSIIPNSCHIFDQDTYTYQMKNPLTLRIGSKSTVL